MELIRRYTMRGVLENVGNSGQVKKIDVFHGSYNRGIRVVRFQVFDMDPIFGNAEVTGFLATEDPSLRSIANPNRVWDWGDNSQIAWAYKEDTLQNHDFIVPNNLVIEDLYVALSCGANLDVGYLIDLELYELDTYQSTLAIVGNMNQG